MAQNILVQDGNDIADGLAKEVVNEVEELEDLCTVTTLEDINTATKQSV